MRHFHHVDGSERRRLFCVEPAPFARDADLDTLALALGATLYLPATRPDLADDLARQGARGVMSSVVCLEDAIADHELAAAEAHTISQLRELARRGPRETVPLIFVRVRHPDQVPAIVAGLGAEADLLSGFVLPKFTDVSGPAFLDAVVEARDSSGLALRAMPVIESREAIYRESRGRLLDEVGRLLAKQPDLVLAVRLGATDLSAAYGIRRSRDLTIYDVRVVADVIADVVNVLGRVDGTGHVVTGPVWEHFAAGEPGSGAADGPLGPRARDLDALSREVVLDRANGLTGKTVIHPTHVGVVHALSVVSHEEHCDATDIVGRRLVSGGVLASSYANKMNEGKAHRAWAERTLRQAAIFGVAAEGVGFADLLAAVGAGPVRTASGRPSCRGR